MSYIKVPQGSTLTFEISVKNSDGTAYDLTNCSIRFIAVDSGGNLVLDKKTGAGITTTNALGGIALVQGTPEEMVELEGTYSFEIRLRNSSNNRLIEVDSGILEVPKSRIGTEV